MEEQIKESEIKELIKAQDTKTASIVRAETIWDIIRLLQKNDDRYGEELVKEYLKKQEGII